MPHPGPTERVAADAPATLAVEAARGGWLSRVRRRTEPEPGPTPPTARELPPYGATLRHAREAQGRSLAQAAAATGIRERYLRALEAEEPLDLFPAPAYARFFLREYAEALDLDADGVVAAFDVRHPPEDEDVPPVRTPAVRDPHPRRRITAVTLVSLSVVALVAMAVAAGSQRDRTSAPLGTTPARAVVPSATPPPTNPSTSERAPIVRHLRAVLRFDATCWVEATSDGSTVVQRTIGTGERLVVRADRKLDLLLGNAGAVTMTLNGEDVRTGSSGAVATLAFRLRDGRVVSTAA